MAIFNGSVENIENNKNKVNTISENATPEQYPTVQAVIDYVNLVLETMKGIDNVKEGNE